ncbi:hypothetical protein EV426DRAFT_700312 [Tirmania nivea]|nr:hypothetical protein EV426DRAFT_700312 [Tirmania nivea]
MLLLMNIKADLYTRVSGFDKKAEIEAIEEITEDTEGSQDERSITKEDEPLEIDKDRD